MPQITMGDLAQTHLFGRRNATLKDSIQSLSSEVTSGLSVEKTERVKGDFTALSGIEASLTLLASFKTVTSETSAMTGQMQLTLNSIAEGSTSLSSSLLAASTSNSPNRINILGIEADQRLQAAISALNTRSGEKSLFAGDATDHAALADADTLMTALTTAVAGEISAADIQTAVNDWFADPSGFQATAYQGGDLPTSIEIGSDQTVQIDITAMDPAIVSMLKGLAMTSLLQRGILSGDDKSRADLAKLAGESLATSLEPFAELTARLGTIEATVINTGVRNDAEKSAMETARLGILAVDPYETATKLQDAQTQLEMLYSITARMSRLSLVNYL
jgi:flagellar hook-associated protein 3 FlgL